MLASSLVSLKPPHEPITPATKDHILQDIDCFLNALPLGTDSCSADVEALVARRLYQTELGKARMHGRCAGLLHHRHQLLLPVQHCKPSTGWHTKHQCCNVHALPACPSSTWQTAVVM